VEFDSQKEYPGLSSFGVRRQQTASDSPKESTAAPPTPPTPQTTITESDVLPIAQSLRQIFNLDLFGFDLLICESTGEMLVVDVNYFPSYKEMKEEWPRLLAEWLVESVITL